MTGHRYQFSIYKPVDAKIVLTNTESGQKIEGQCNWRLKTRYYRALKRPTSGRCSRLLWRRSTPVSF
jgi:hypothetical protein